MGAFLGTAHQVGQALVGGIVTGADHALLGVAVALVLGVTGRFHVAFAFVYTATAYLAAVLRGGGLPLPLACLVGLLAGVVLGVAAEAFVYRPVADRAGGSGNAALLAVAVAGLGVVLAGENLIRLLGGDGARPLGGFPVHTFSLGGVSITLLELTSVVVAVLVVTALALALDRTGLGQQIRAVRSNPELARAVGVDVRRIVLVVFAIAALVGGVAALVAGMRLAAAPDMGLVPTFTAFVVAFVAGPARSPARVAAVGLGIGLVETLSTLWLPADRSTLTVFGLLLAWITARAVRQPPRALSPGIRPVPSGR